MWETIIEDSIKNIHKNKTYVNNELAFLAIQGKIELQLRDKIAWYIEQNINAGQYIEENINAGPYRVRREYNAPGNKGRKKCDLAILDNNMNPVCLIEFKAHSAATYESKYEQKCKDDIAKMQDIASSTGTTPEKYYIFFLTEHNGTLPGDNGLIAYYDIIDRALNSPKKLGITNILKKWNTYYSSFGAITELQIDAGQYYGLKVDIHAMMLKV